MEKQFDKEHKLDRWIKEAPLEKAPHDFTQKVMAQIEAKRQASLYQPLIPKWVWVLILLGVAALLLGANGASSSDNLIEIGKWFQKITIHNPLEGLSKTSLYAIGFMLLFLLQIPFLKRLLEKNYG